MTVQIAGSMGFKDGMAKAKAVLLEPIMKVEVITPDDYFLGIEPPTVKSSNTYPLPGSPGSMCSLQ